MKMPVVLEPSMVEEMARIGVDRLPNEACGVLVPTPHRGQRVFEIPNRSMTPHDSFEMKSEDIVIALEGWIRENPHDAAWEKIAIWHTHPGGGVGPSRHDRQNRIEHCGNLVVSIIEDGPPVAVWF